MEPEVDESSPATTPEMTSLSATEVDAYQDGCNLYDLIVCTFIIGTVCVFGLAGNFLSYLVLHRHKQQTAAIFLLKCMAVFDFLLLVVTLLIYTFPSFVPYSGRMEGFFGWFDDNRIYVWPLAMILHTVTVWLTVLVTVNRYNAVCRAVEEFGNKTMRSTQVSVLVLVLLSVLYNTPRFFEHNEIPVSDHELTADDYNTTSTIASYETASANMTSDEPTPAVRVLAENEVYQIIYSNVLYYPVMYLMPLGSLGYLNFKLITALKNIKKKALSSGRRNAGGEDNNITRCVIAIVCVFFVCQTPALLNQIFWATISRLDGAECGRFHFYYTKMSDFLVVVNSSCNFVVYCLFGRTFRQIFLATICCNGEGTPSKPKSARHKYTLQVDTNMTNVRH